MTCSLSFVPFSPNVARALSQPHWLGLQANGKARRDRVDKLVAQGDDFSRAGTPAIDERKCVTAGDSCVAERIALMKAGALDQPCRRKLYLAVLRRISGNAPLFNAELLGQ